MKPPRRGAGRSHAAYPSVGLDIDTIMTEMPRVHRFLRWLGVRHPDVPDVAQVVALAAWRASEAGRFRPPPGKPLHLAVCGWMFGICWRQACHYREAAHRRYEMATGLLLDVVVPDDLDGRLDALAQLGALDTVPEPQRKALLLRALGFEYRVLAVMLGVPLGTSSTRVRLGRERFRRSARRRRGW